MANCFDCRKNINCDCDLVENGNVQVYEENKEKTCEQFDSKILRESNMADNDRFVIIKQMMFENVPNKMEITLHKKTISEYEDMIAEIINKEIDVVLNGRGNVTIKTLAKAVVGRLFGEGE